VILLLRGYDDIGSTVIEVLRRYTEALQANSGKLILAGISRYCVLSFNAPGVGADRRGEYLPGHRYNW